MYGVCLSCLQIRVSRGSHSQLGFKEFTEDILFAERWQHSDRNFRRVNGWMKQMEGGGGATVVALKAMYFRVDDAPPLLTFSLPLLTLTGTPIR